MAGTPWAGTIRIAVAGRPVLTLIDGRVRDDPDEHVSQASSISKQLMAVVVLQLVEEGRLELADTVGRLLPDAPPAWSAITVHQLLTHTSGLGHWDDVAGLDLGSGVTRAEVDALVAAAPLVAAPGARFAYSGPGFLTLAAVVAAVEQRAYGDVIGERVLGPAGMTATSSGRLRPDAAAGEHDGATVPVDPVFTAMPGTGDLWTTTRDLLAFATALRDGRLLDPASFSAMTTRHAEIAGSEPGDLMATAYGYGTFLGTVAGHDARFHPGDNPGYRSLLAYLPAVDADVAVLLHDDAAHLGPVVAAAVDRALGPGVSPRGSRRG